MYGLVNKEDKLCIGVECYECKKLDGEIFHAANLKTYKTELGKPKKVKDFEVEMLVDA